MKTRWQLAIHREQMGALAAWRKAVDTRQMHQAKPLSIIRGMIVLTSSRSTAERNGPARYLMCAHHLVTET